MAAVFRVPSVSKVVVVSGTSVGCDFDERSDVDVVTGPKVVLSAPAANEPGVLSGVSAFGAVVECIDGRGWPM